METIAKASLPLFWIGIFLTSCSGLTSLPEITSTSAAGKTATATPAPIASATFVPTATIVSPTLSVDEAAFWANAIPLSEDISVTEYDFPSGTDPSYQSGLSWYVPVDTWWYVSTGDVLPTIQVLRIQDLGYEWKVVGQAKQCNQESPKGRNRCTYQLYKDKKLLWETKWIADVSTVYHFSTKAGPIHAFVVTVGVKRDSFLIQNGVVIPWGWEDYEFASPPILYQDELLWARLRPDGRIEVQKSNGDILFTFKHKSKAFIFKEWNGHWVLEAGNVLVIDGEEPYQKLGFQQIFMWNLVKDKPAFFFQKGSKFGISYDGQILPLQYDEIANGLCCEASGNNPYIGSDFARFLGKRNGVWYYVLVKFK